MVLSRIEFLKAAGRLVSMFQQSVLHSLFFLKLEAGDVHLLSRLKRRRPIFVQWWILQGLCSLNLQMLRKNFFPEFVSLGLFTVIFSLPSVDRKSDSYLLAYFLWFGAFCDSCI